ncbi:MAG: class I SAM-dependent methyltransferase [Deltaproteobacteria bacterium]|nr:class I SAM-dependent methyltransferase [Deltaproteobacteria bacterium]
MFANRVRRNHARLAPGFARRDIEAFRLYDRDIPEIRAVADWYAGHLVVAEYARAQTRDLPDWLPSLAAAAARALDVPADRVHTRVRRTRPQAGERYRKLGHASERWAIREGPLRFWVNLDDYVDTGLFADHRETRRLVAAESQGRRCANLFAYTGAFTVAMAHAGAAATVSVDTSPTYLAWLADNLVLNGLAGPAHVTAQVDARTWLDWRARQGGPLDVVVCDPPSFSDRPEGAFDVQRDHRDLILACLAVLAPGGVLWFSANHQRFVPQLDGLPADVAEMTARTVPIDYRNRSVHRCWRLVRRPA